MPCLYLTLSRLKIDEKQSGLFRDENALNLTHDFWYDNFDNKVELNLLVETVIQKHTCQI